MMKWTTYLDTKNNARIVEVTLGGYNKKNKKYYSMEGYQETLKKVSKTKLKISGFPFKSSEDSWISYKKQD